MKRTKTRKTRLQRSLLATALVSCLAVTAPSYAQTATATLRGTVAGADAGTPVTATNVETGSTRTTQTSASGTYSLVGLPPGTYTVRSGGSEQTVTLAVASSSTLNLQANTGVAETAAEGPVTDMGAVVVSAPLLKDVKTSEVGNTVSLRQIQQLPQATRNFLEFADTVPGMAFTTDDQGFTSLRGGATNSASGNLYIDGVGQKGYVEDGGVAGQRNSRGNPFPQLAIGEYKVITSNYKAEYGQITGAAVTAATRSGTNEFEGEAYYRFTDQSLREKRAAEEAPGAEKTDSQTKEWGLAFGGPIVPDKMHFFVAYEKKDLITPRVVVPDSNASTFVQYLPSDVQALYGPISAPFEEDLYFAKISWDATDSDRFELSGQFRDEVQVDSIGDQRAPDHGRDVINKDTRAVLRWQHSADTWFNELLATTEKTETNPFPMGIGNGIRYIVLNRNPDTGAIQNEWTLLETGPSSGFDAFQREQKGWSVENNFTYTGFDRHTIKTGLSYKSIELTAQDGGAINPQFSYEVTADGVAATPFKVDFLAPFNEPGYRLTVQSDVKQTGFYIQDDWEVNDKLLLNLGIRYDYEDNPAYTDFVTSPTFVAALYADDPDNPGQPWANRLLLSGIDVADYINDGNDRDNFDRAWAPRFGFSYDMNADERHVVHGGAGRSYDRNLFKYLALEQSKAAISPVNIRFQDPATGECYIQDDSRPCVPWDPRYLNGVDELASIPAADAASEMFLLKNDLKTPYSDQFSLGMTNQVGDWLTDVTVQRILSYDGFVFTLINRHPDGRFFNDTGDAPWGEPVPGYLNSILGSNGIESQNTQLLLSAEKPYTKQSGWSLSVAYTHTDAKHNRQVDEPYAFDGATIDAYPFIWVNGVPKHRIVAAGSIDGPWGLTFGAKIVLETPRPINDIRRYGANLDQDAPAIGFEPPGTGSFLVGGDIWGYRTVDLQVTKEFKFGDRFALSARMNLLNAFNYKNYSNFNLFSAGADGVYDIQGEYNKFGNMYYQPRTLSFEVGLKF